MVLYAEDIVASHASALKAHRQNVVRRERNRQLRARLRGALKAIRAAVDKNEFAAVKDQLKEAVSLVDRMVSKGIIHKNAAARYKSRLSSRVTKKTTPKAS
jgi:small subunit ribosomal protein S20